MPLSLVEGPTQEPISGPQVQLQARIDVDDDLALIETVIIPAARDRCELATRRAMLPQTWDYILEQFPSNSYYLEIPKPPLTAIVSVTYIDTQGVTRTWDPSIYLTQMPAGPRCLHGRIALPYAGIWPITQQRMGAVTVRFTCGYADVDAVPPLLRAAMLQDAARLYEYRESLVVDSRAVGLEVPGGARDIYRSYMAWPTQRQM